MKKKLAIMLISLMLLVSVSACMTPQFVKGEQYIVEGSFTSMHTENGKVVYVVGGINIVLTSKQEQPKMVIGQVYKIIWRMSDVIELISVEDESE